MIARWVGIGEIKSAADGEVLAAVLGSCVSTIVWHPGRRFALMNHVLLPTRLLACEDDQPGRYADESWWLMAELLAAESIALRDCLCYLVGGGSGLEAPAVGSVGDGNIVAARNLLAAAGARIESMETGDRFYRVASFDAGSGELNVSRRPSRYVTCGQETKT